MGSCLGRSFGTLTVDVIAARDLANFDVDKEGDLTDAYMQLYLHDSLGREGIQRTRVVEDDLCPEYHQTFVFTLSGPIDKSSMLSVQCIDADGLLDEFMGECRIKLWRILKFRSVTDWFPLTNTDDRIIGHIHMRILYEPSPETAEEETLAKDARAARKAERIHARKRLAEAAADAAGVDVSISASTRGHSASFRLTNLKRDDPKTGSPADGKASPLGAVPEKEPPTSHHVPPRSVAGPLSLAPQAKPADTPTPTEDPARHPPAPVPVVVPDPSSPVAARPAVPPRPPPRPAGGKLRDILRQKAADGPYAVPTGGVS
eukprot:TRINITY_DN72135_c0_g1_i1.p1 TRINITY_DN72135_c0_g1~~TRINITY_DN72135_c0_g1_i1.p1  ORF type:complete len:317 (+),score=25.45 TRINITY_DN72135_c0_g1_i1:205-1155(+)